MKQIIAQLGSLGLALCFINGSTHMKGAEEVVKPEEHARLGSPWVRMGGISQLETPPEELDKAIEKETQNRIANIEKLYSGEGPKSTEIRNFLSDKVRKDMTNYKQAVIDSEFLKREKRKIFRPVLKNPRDKSVIWNKEHTAVLVVSFIPAWAVDKIYLPAAKKSLMFKTPPWNERKTIYCWVTFVPEVKNFGIKYIADNKLFEEPASGTSKKISWYFIDRIKLTDRINQFLGLIPFSEDYNSHDIRAVEMWVKPEDLFRPCENPSPFVNSCSIPPKHPMIEPDFNHPLFLDTKKEQTWTSSPFPWTNWGFSYDWGPNAAEHHIGATELAIKPNSKVIFHLPRGMPSLDFASLEMYCHEVPIPKSETISVKMPK